MKLYQSALLKLDKISYVKNETYGPFKLNKVSFN